MSDETKVWMTVIIAGCCLFMALIYAGTRWDIETGKTRRLAIERGCDIIGSGKFTNCKGKNNGE